MWWYTDCQEPASDLAVVIGPREAYTESPRVHRHLTMTPDRTEEADPTRYPIPDTESSFESAKDAREEYFESQPTGIELEDSGQTEDPEPWDAEKIRIHTKHYSLRHIVDMISDGDIDLAPDFQRNYVWKDWQRSGLIESLLLGIPLPSFYFNEDTIGGLQVVDGVQRLTTISEYVNDPDFKLGKVAYLHELVGQGYRDLETSTRRRFTNTQFVAHVIDPQTPYRLKFDVFRRINTGGTPLSSQEIRHCMSKTQSRKFLKELANHPSFISATGGALQSHPRMADREVGSAPIRRVSTVYPGPICKS